MDDRTLKLLRYFSDNAQNSTIEKCCTEVMLGCRDLQAKNYPLTIAALICNRLRSLRSDAAQ